MQPASQSVYGLNRITRLCRERHVAPRRGRSENPWRSVHVGLYYIGGFPPAPPFPVSPNVHAHITRGLGTKKDTECCIYWHHIRNTRDSGHAVSYLASQLSTYRTDTERERESKYRRWYGGCAGDSARSTCSHKPWNIHFAQAHG